MLLNISSIVELDMPVGLVVSAFLLLGSEPLAVPQVGASQAHFWASEEDGSYEKATEYTVLNGSDAEESPVEVVMLPELLEVNASLHDTLLLGGIDAAAVENSKLDVSGHGISASHWTLEGSIEKVGSNQKLRLVGQPIFTKVIKNILVGSIGSFLEVELMLSILPSSDIISALPKLICHIK